MLKSNMFITIMSIMLGVLIPGAARAESPKDILIIANQNISVNSMSVEELKRIFLVKQQSWSNGQRIVCINANESTTLREKFRQKVLGMTRDEELTYWEKEKIRRQLSPPPEFASIPKAVFSLKNAISYSFRKDVPDNVAKILMVIPQ